MKKPKRKISRLSKDASDHEIIRWTNPMMYLIVWKLAYLK
jgi:hypothetical protein